MQIDHTHRPWLIATLVLLGISVAAYAPQALLSVHGPSGGSWLGLTLGIAAFGMMAFAGLLGFRSRFPVWRIGRARTWMKGHLWLGTLSLPLALLHAGFHLGGTLTTVLTILTILVVASGILGAVLQHHLPPMMTAQVPGETIFEQMDSARRLLAEEARDIAASVQKKAAATPTPPPDAPAVDPSLPKTFQLAAMMDAQAKLDKKETVLLLQPSPKEADRFQAFYDREVKPFLDAPADKGHDLGIAAQAGIRFHQLRTVLPASFTEAVNDLESVCEEARQLNRQAELHRWLHGWLLFHIPLSYAVLLLAVVHAWMALRF